MVIAIVLFKRMAALRSADISEIAGGVMMQRI